MTKKRVMKLASRGKRFGAACIDISVPFVSYLLYLAVMAANGINAYYPGYDFGNGFGYGYGYGFGYGFGYGNGLGSHHLRGASAVVMAVVFIVLLAYIVVQMILYAKGKTIGKAAIGLQVVSSKDGKPLGFWKMLFRECIVKSASGSVLGLGYIWILIDEKNRGWHDKILDTFVVDLKESEMMNYRRNLEMARAEKQNADAVTAEAAKKPEDISEAVRQPEDTAEAAGQPEDTAEAAIQTENKPEVVPEITLETVPDDTAEDLPSAEEPETAEDAIPPVTETEDAAEPETEGLSMSMKKEELLNIARERGVQVSARATKAAIIEAIEKSAEETDTEF